MNKVSKKFASMLVAALCLMLVSPVNAYAEGNTNHCSGNWKKVFTGSTNFTEKGVLKVTKKATQKKFEQMIEEGCSFKVVYKRVNTMYKSRNLASFECAYVGMELADLPNPYFTCISAGGLDVTEAFAKNYAMTLDFVKNKISLFGVIENDSYDFSIFAKK